MRRSFLTAVSLTLTFTPALAHAGGDILCTDLPNPVIGAGGSASKPLLALVGAALNDVADPITLVYQSPGACFGITAYVDDTPITGTASYWDAAGNELSCTLPVLGVNPDFGMLGVQATQCEGVDAIPDGIGEFIGPVTSWSLIVHEDSTQTSISSEGVYFVYGFGASAGQVSPWTEDAELYSRNATSAAWIAVALGAGIPPSRVVGTDVGTNGAMITAVSSSLQPEAAIGFVSTEVADGNRDIVNTLAFQAPGQSCAYWPDSTATAFDKQNVRDGHYNLWSPYRFYAPVDGSGAIVHEATRRVIGYFDGSEPLPAELPLLDLEIDNGNIPQCAMEVWRDDEIGPLYSQVADAPCGCYYEFRATGATSCTECTDDPECPAEAPTCRYGYCEVQ
ncbi:MAG TPA: hypothetical protein VG755_16965 [Nannocystaceae bacterium]|nr:hypothetical protein [Nannocystaceae bacterium]